MSETFLNIDYCNNLKFQDKPIPGSLSYEPAVKNPCDNIHCFDVMLIFPN